MTAAEIMGGLVVLVGVIAGFAGVPVLNPRRLIHISIRVRLAAPEQASALRDPRATSRSRPSASRPRTSVSRNPSPRLLASSMMLLAAQRAPVFEVGSRWG